VLGQNLLDGATEGELRFHVGRALALLQRRATVMVDLDDRRLAVLVPAIVKSIYPTYELEGAVEEALVNDLAREVGKLLPRRVRATAGPIALECVGETAGGSAGLAVDVGALVDRVGLLAAGNLRDALRALWRLAGLPANPSSGHVALEQSAADPRCAATLRFFVSASHAAARTRLGLSAPV
jgi:hypothetical protein